MARKESVAVRDIAFRMVTEYGYAGAQRILDIRHGAAFSRADRLSLRRVGDWVRRMEAAQS